MEWNSCSYIPSLRSELDGSKFCSILSDHYHRRQNCCYRCHHHLMPAQLWCPKKSKRARNSIGSGALCSSSLDPHNSFAVGCRGAERVHFAPRLSLSVRVHIRDRERVFGWRSREHRQQGSSRSYLSVSVSVFMFWWGQMWTQQQQQQWYCAVVVCLACPMNLLVQWKYLPEDFSLLSSALSSSPPHPPISPAPEGNFAFFIIITWLKIALSLLAR